MAELPEGSVPEPPARVIGSAPPRPPTKSAPVREKRAAEPKTALGIFDDYGFPVVSAVEHICGRRDFPLAGGTLTWDAFASDSSPAELIARYRKRIGSQGFEQKGAGGVWKLPVDAALARSLEVLTPNAPGPHRACKAKPAPAAKSIILVSRR